VREKWHTDQYVTYLKSKEWAAKRKEKLESVGHKCQRHDDIRSRENIDGTFSEVRMCSASLEVHHRNYDNLGNEPLCDLVVLCKWHHENEHEHIDSNRYARNRFKKGLDTYASKKYGEDWVEDLDYDEIAQEFDDWLDSVS